MASPRSLGLTGQSPHVEIQFDLIGDHVQLRAPVDDRRGDRHMRAGVRLAGEADIGIRLAEIVDGVRVDEHRADLRGQRHAAHETAPCIVHARRRLERSEAPYDLGRGDERIVGAQRCRGVTCHPTDP